MRSESYFSARNLTKFPPTPLRILFAFFYAALCVHLILAAHRPKISSELFVNSSSWPDQVAQLPVTVFYCSCRRPVRVSFLISLLVRVAIALALLSSFFDRTFRPGPVAVAEKWRVCRLWIDNFLGTTRTTYVRSDPWSLPEARIAEFQIMRETCSQIALNSVPTPTFPACCIFILWSVRTPLRVIWSNIGINSLGDSGGMFSSRSLHSHLSLFCFACRIKGKLPTSTSCRRTPAGCKSFNGFSVRSTVATLRERNCWLR